MERGWRETSPNCPRCGSSNTKFCYYNNYSLTQPRYFCKGCRRYWTKGGSLRSVPIGGGCRKSRRSRSSALRLATSNPHHLGFHGSRSTSNTIFGHGDLNNQLGHDSYVSPSGELSSIVEHTSSSMNPPAIDLAAVYANFLSQKPDSLDSMVVKSSIDESTHIDPSSRVMLQDQKHIDVINCSNNPPFSQELPSMPQGKSKNDHNQMFFTEFSTPIHLHNHHEEISIQEELVGLPPLPGESLSQEHNLIPWAPSTLDDHDQHPNLQGPIRVLPDLEPDSHLSNLFVGSWSPIDLPGFETSSSSSKP